MTGGPNLLDAVLVLLLAVAALRGRRHGAVSQLAAFGGLAAGAWAGIWAAPRVADLVVAGGPDGGGRALLTLVLLIGAVLAGHGVGLAVGARLHRRLHRLRISGVDRAAGVVVGAVGFLAAVWLLAGVFAQGPSVALAQQVHGSAVVGALPPSPDVVGRASTVLGREGFPQVFTGPRGGIALPASPPAGTAAVRAAAAAGQPGTVQVLGTGCGGRIGAGSGFVAEPGFVVTNAHVVAGFGQVRVRDAAGDHPARVVGFDPRLDVAVLAVDGVAATALEWTDTPAGRGTEGATLGFPGGGRELVVRPATVQGRIDALGRDIHGAERVRREVVVLTAPVERGDSGGPFVTADGRVGGVVFAGDPGDRAVGYALTAEQVRPVVAAAVARGAEVGVGDCRV